MAVVSGALSSSWNSYGRVWDRLKSDLRSSHRENRENPAKHPTRIDDCFHRRRHSHRKIELALVFSVPRGGGHGTDNAPRGGYAAAPNTPYIILIPMKLK